MFNSNAEQEAQLLMNQGKQPALIVNEDPQRKTLLLVVLGMF